MNTIYGSVFRFCALTGVGMLVIQGLLSLIGSDHDSHEINDGGSSLADGKFKWMSRQTLTAFIMMFGCAGLVCSEQFSLSILISLLVALSTATASALLIALIFRLAQKAHSPGTVFKIEDAIGKEAMVYHRIPKGTGKGKISISLHHFTHEIDAISLHEGEIPSFTPVQIIKKADDTTVVVIPLK